MTPAPTLSPADARVPPPPLQKPLSAAATLTLSPHSVRNQLLAQGPMSQFSTSLGRSFMLHSSSSTTSPMLLTHFTSRVLCPTPQGTEHCNTASCQRAGGQHQLGCLLVTCPLNRGLGRLPELLGPPHAMLPQENPSPDHFTGPFAKTFFDILPTLSI